jgi:hypothetical protein
MMVVRDLDRVRLISRGGYDWADRFPLVVSAALKLPEKHFVIDGEVVVLDKAGVSDFDALASRKHEMWISALDTHGSVLRLPQIRVVHPTRSSWRILARALRDEVAHVRHQHVAAKTARPMSPCGTFNHSVRADPQSTPRASSRPEARS